MVIFSVGYNFDGNGGCVLFVNYHTILCESFLHQGKNTFNFAQLKVYILVKVSTSMKQDQSLNFFNFKVHYLQLQIAILLF